MRDDEYPADKAARYGVHVHDTLTLGETKALRESVDHGRRVSWTHPDLAKIIRFRLIGASYEYPYWDVSYVYGEMKDGSRVLVVLPFHRLPRFGWKRKVVEYALEARVHAKRLGMFDDNVVSTVAG